jgi:glycosyltransferase involved in cell wall biosynthesis
VEGVIRAYKFLLDKKFAANIPNLVIYGKLLPGLTLALDAKKLIRELNLTKKVKLLDMVPQVHMPAIFANAMFFVYPSRYEGFGMPVLEAMSQGKPVITSKVSSLPEVGRDSVLYCQPDDIYDIAMVMKNVFSNRELREDLSRRAKERSKNFSWGKFTKKTLNIVENLHASNS